MQKNSFLLVVTAPQSSHELAPELSEKEFTLGRSFQELTRWSEWAEAHDVAASSTDHAAADTVDAFARGWEWDTRRRLVA
jgi:hypothetical protein